MSYLAPYLPVEIVEEILRNLDGITLARAGLVCSTWRAIVHGLTKKTTIWKEICRTELSLEETIEITSQLYPASRMKTLWTDSSVDWHLVFKTKHSLKLVGNNASESRMICRSKNTKENINCIKLSGSCILTGHEDGRVQIWSQDGVFLDQLTLHERLVTDISVVSFLHELPSSLWDIKHEFVISTSADRSFQINPICPVWMAPKDHSVVIRAHGCATTMVRSHGNDFVVVSEDAHMSVWKLTAPSEPFGAPKVTLLAHIQQRSYTLLTINFWAMRLPDVNPSLTVTGVSDEGRLMMVRLFPTETENPDTSLFWTQQLGREPVLQTDLGEDSSSKRVLHNASGYIWRDELFIWITGEQTICISVDGELYKEFNTMPYLHGIPVSVLVFQSLFIIGLDSGAVVIYHFSRTEDLMELDLGAKHHRVQMGDSPITQLTISVARDAIMLLAVSNSDMHITCLL